VEHVLASASVSVNYDYTKLEAIEFFLDNDKGKILTTNSSPNLRHFWDGRYINNTPLRELINEHQRYWIDRIGANKLEEQLQARVLNPTKKVRLVGIVLVKIIYIRCQI
jgi:predicted acylesterase/phospholipase RssA